MGASPSRRLLVPEAIQSSGMDCGPAALKALLEGFDIRVSYGRLREACQTDVDGTSIDSLEEVAVQLGLDAEQIMIPADHLLVDDARALPCLVVIWLPNGLTHFVIAWRRFGPWIELMDPGSGRRWMTGQAFLAQCYIHRQRVPADGWRQWVASDESLQPLRQRMASVGVAKGAANALIEQASSDPKWTSFGALDAAIRMVGSLRRAGALKKQEATRILQPLFEQGLASGVDAIPNHYWSVRPSSGPDATADSVETSDPGKSDGDTKPDSEATELVLRGVVLVRVKGLLADREADRDRDEKPAGQQPEGQPPAPADKAPLSPELVAALEETPVSAARTLFGLIRDDGLLAPGAVLGASLVAAGTVLVEALLLRSLFDLGTLFSSPTGRLGSLLALALFFLLLWLLEKPILDGMLRVGRHLEVRLRATLLTKIPRLENRYFASRLVSDMAERGHAVHRIRSLPVVVQRAMRSAAMLLFTTAGIIWLDPGSALIALLAAISSLGLPLLLHPLLAERDFKVRSHNGALSRFYLDAILGLTAIRTHGAERSVRREHESLLREWRIAGSELLRVSVWVQGLQNSLGFAFAGWLLVDHLGRAGLTGGVLLLVYWVLRLPDLGQRIAVAVRQYPSLRSITLRLMEPLTAPEEEITEEIAEEVVEEVVEASAEPATTGAGTAVTLDNVWVTAGGHQVLRGINVDIAAGEQVAVVGPSGAGKSTLVGLLLGWHRPSQGSIRIDGAELDAGVLEQVRRRSAWVDPAVQLWNRSFFANLHYGNDSVGTASMDQILDQADLSSVLERLPQGLRTQLGEGGGLVSGGEGQRVRLGRALFRQDVRLAILDEPFRGLDREKRRLLLQRVRDHWQGATLLCVTHDVTDTRSFPRVLVVEDGAVVEDGTPSDLLARDSRYAALVQAEEATRELWRDGRWRKLTLDGGKLEEAS